MSKALITESLLTAIADAIRAKTGGAADLTPAEMATAIEEMETGGDLEKWFCNDPTLTEIETATTRYNYTFAGNDSVRKITITSLWNFGSLGNPACFYHCHGLEEVIFTAPGEFVLTGMISGINTGGGSAYPSFYFQEATALKGNSSSRIIGSDLVTRFEAPKCSNWAQVFPSYSNTHLVDVDGGLMSNIGYNNDLYQLSALKNLVLRAGSVCTLSAGTNIHTSSPIKTGGGYVYVPRTLITTYQTATNWSAIYASNPDVFRAIEDYSVDGTLTGRMDWARMI